MHHIYLSESGAGAGVKHAPERYEDAHQGEHDTQS